MTRLTHAAVSLAVVLLTYAIYARVAVPLIEPSIAGPSLTSLAGSPLEPVEDQRVALLEKIFPPGVLDLKKTKVLENDRVMLLLENYKNLDDGSVKLEPCTMVFLWDGPAEDEAQRLRQSVILQAPEGAILKFDSPIDLSALKIGRLKSGTLLGKITISSQGKSSGPEDDLLIHTSKLELSEQEVWTINPVEFSWGKNFGVGREMHIKLLSDPAKSAKDRNTPNISGMEKFEMRHIDSLHLETSAPARPKNSSPAAQPNAFAPSIAASDLPMDISCNGVFTFNFVKREATFADNVCVSRVNPNGPADQIQSDLLTVYFVPKGGAKSDSNDISNLEPERIEARGHPVLINSRLNDLAGQGEHLVYNIKTNLVSLDGGPEVFIRQAANEIHARSLQYQSLGQNGFGRAAAQGPGWIRGQFDGNQQNRLEARWNDKLYMEPKDQYQQISFTGGAVLNYPGLGNLQAKEIIFWLIQAPSSVAGRRPDLTPYYMKALDGVAIESERLSLNMRQQMEIWFEPAAAVESFPAQSPALADAYSRPQSANQNSTASLQPDENSQHVKISGGTLQARMKLRDRQVEDVLDIMIQDGVQLEQTQAAASNSHPLLIQGDNLRGTNLLAQNTVVKVTGRPAHCEALGMGLSGANINLNKAMNRLWIEGPGRMDLPLSGNMLAQSFAPQEQGAQPGVLLIEWKKGMDFDGRMATFQDSVTASAPQFRLQTQTLKAQLKRPVNFADPNPSDQGQNDVENLFCQGGVFLENHSLDTSRQPISYDRMKVADLAVNLQNGALSAGGPGWLNRVFLAPPDIKENRLGAALPGARPAAPAPGAAARRIPQLYCLHVAFQGSITGNFQGLIAGNLNQSEISFKQHVGAAYAPVIDWSATIDPEKPDQLGSKGIALHCDKLTITQMPLPGGKDQSIETEASGNAVAEGQKFTARAQHITYSDMKKLLNLEGDGRAPAKLFLQDQPGVPSSSTDAVKLQYNLKTGEINIINGGSLEFTPGKQR